MYQERFYRDQVSFQFILEATYKESDLYICSDKSLTIQPVLEIIKKYYHEIETYSKARPEFISSLSPIDLDLSAPPIIRDMLKTCQETGIGPFASVAGAIALYVGNELLGQTEELIIENGGDIFLKITRDITMKVYLGDNFSYSSKGGTLDSLVLRVKKRDAAFGIASSSAFIGESLNFGKTDLVTLIARDAIIADGFVTALSNRVKKRGDIDPVLQCAKHNPDLYGILIAFQGEIFLWGDLALDG